jgi:hypothetical protein
MKKLGVGLVALTSVLVLAAAAAGVPITINGTIDANDLSQTARLGRDGVVSTCAALKAFPGTLGTGTRHYDSYTYTNGSGSTECVTVTLTQTSGTTGALFTAAYFGSFNPADVATNYLADAGSSGLLNQPATYSFQLAAGQTAVIVVNEVNQDACNGCDYTLTIDTPTAVTFASARVTSTKQGELIRWRTGSETDLLFFRVYRSHGDSWRLVSRSPIAAKGSVAGASYRFLDRTARPGTAYRYRIKAFDRDGTSSWFGPVLS